MWAVLRKRSQPTSPRIRGEGISRYTPSFCAVSQADPVHPWRGGSPHGGITRARQPKPLVYNRRKLPVPTLWSRGREIRKRPYTAWPALERTTQKVSSDCCLVPGLLEISKFLARFPPFLTRANLQFPPSHTFSSHQRGSHPSFFQVSAQVFLLNRERLPSEASCVRQWPPTPTPQTPSRVAYPPLTSHDISSMCMLCENSMWSHSPLCPYT